MPLTEAEELELLELEEAEAKAMAKAKPDKSKPSKEGGSWIDSASEALSSANDKLHEWAGVKKLPGAGPIPDPGLLMPLLFGPGVAKSANALKSSEAGSLVRITNANSKAPILYENSPGFGATVEKAVAENSLTRRLAKKALKVGAHGATLAGGYLLNKLIGKK